MVLKSRVFNVFGLTSFILFSLKEHMQAAKELLLPLTLNHGGLASRSSSPYSSTFSPIFFAKITPLHGVVHLSSTAIDGSKIHLQDKKKLKCVCFLARRRVIRYDEEDVDDRDEEYGYNSEISMLESYSSSARNEALLVRAMVDDKEEQILIFKGFSSSLSDGTSPDPSTTILPARAKITSIDRIKCPFDPSNVEYIEKGLTWDEFKSYFQINHP